MKSTLLVASHNRGKLLELTQLVSGLDVVLLSLADIELDLVVEESGETFEENAVLKATNYAEASGMLTLADDSGLEVDFLEGKPGVQTARYGGSNLSPKQRYLLLLDQLQEVPWESRRARFRCSVAVARPDRLVGTAEGTCEGFIAFDAAGDEGFGYDPVFYLPQKEATLAQLPPETKHQVSHRGKALARIMPLLRRELGIYS